MNDQEKDKLFGEIGIKLGFFSSEDVVQALEQQKVDEAIGARKPIGAYLFEAKKITKEQIAQIIKEQSNYDITSPSSPSLQTSKEPISETKPSQATAGVTACKACGKEVGVSVAICPHCGTSLKTSWLKVGCLLIILGGLAISGLTCMGFLGAVNSVTKTQEEQKKVLLDQLRNGPISPEITPESLYPIFKLGTEFTDIQRENKTKEILGKKVRWVGVVYDANKSTEGYKIQLKDTSSQIGAFIYLEGHGDAAFVERLKEGDQVIAVGIIEDVFMRSIQLKPAYLELPGTQTTQSQVIPTSSPNPDPTFTTQFQNQPPALTETGLGSSVETKETVNVKTVADALYSAVFKADLSPKPEAVQQFLTPRLYSLIIQEAKRPLTGDDDEPAYQFVPGNGGADGYTIQSPVVSGSIASIGVCFYFKDEPVNPNWKIYLQLEKQSNNQWLVTNLFDVCDDGSIGGNVVFNITSALNRASYSNRGIQSQPANNTGSTQIEIVNIGSLTTWDKEIVDAIAKALSAAGKSCPKAFIFQGKGNRDGREIYTIQGGENFSDHFATSAWYHVDANTGEIFNEDIAESTLVPTGLRIKVEPKMQKQAISPLVMWVKDKDGVVLRNAPARSGQKILIMPFGLQVMVDDTNGPSETIVGITAKWFRVRVETRAGLQEGWCFGGLLSDKEPKK